MHASEIFPFMCNYTKRKCVRCILVLILFYWIRRIKNINLEIWWRFAALKICCGILIVRRRLAVTGEVQCTELFHFCSFWAKTTKITKKRFMSNLLQSLENTTMHCKIFSRAYMSFIFPVLEKSRYQAHGSSPICSWGANSLVLDWSFGKEF